jgi:acyl-coenzyme A synthetase/AMP-(fatty) acid ligase
MTSEGPKARGTLATYEAARKDFRWHIPETFNFGADVVDYWARENDGIALIWTNAAGEEKTFRYSDIARQSNKFGNVLRERGVRKGDRVVIMLPRLPEWMIAMTAVMKLGAVPIPCIEMLTERDLAYRVENSGATAVICRAEQTQKFAGMHDAIPVRVALGSADGWMSYDVAMAQAAETLEPARVAAEDPAIMYYTSGSTGHPKAVVHASRAIYAWRVSAIYWLDLSPGDRIWCTADTGWSKAGTSIMIGPWSVGACSFFYDGPFSADERLRLLARHKITVYCAPGTELFRLVNEDIGRHDLSHLRRVVSAGEAVSPVIAERWEKVSGLRVDEAYGQTEALMLVNNYPGDPVKYGSMGRSLPGSTLDVLDAQGKVLAQGEEGDLALLMPNPQMMLGYWRDEERTAACFIENPSTRWYLTGDRAERDADGYLWYRGRSDDVINSAGYRIGPLEVENALMEHPAVQACAVVGAPDAERGEIVKAFVVLREGVLPRRDLVQELQDHVKTITAPYKYPRAVEFIDQLPMTLTGKIRRRALREQKKSPG